MIANREDKTGVKKAIFLIVLFFVPLILYTSGDPLILRFFNYIYLPVGTIYTIFIWLRPKQEMMFYVTLAPILFLVSAWVVSFGNALLSNGIASFSFSSVVVPLLASIIYLFLSFFYVLLSYGIYHLFREFEFLEWKMS